MGNTKKKHTILHTSFLLIFMTGISSDAISRPENIKPDLSYYADDYTFKENIAELGEEKNYEEVFKNYEYYETIYDEERRPLLFRAYKRGDIIWTEHYFYGDNGKLIKKEITKHGKPEKIIHFKPE